MLDHGVPTNHSCALPQEALTDTMVLLGMPGTARGRVMERLLVGTRTMGLPWIHIAASGQRELTSQVKLWPKHMLIDEAISGSARAMPICHPLLPPPGCPLARFQDALLHVLGSTFGLPTSASVVLRPALREAYHRAGWIGEHTGGAITPADLAEQIEVQMQSQPLSREISELLTTNCVLPLRDLADSAPWLFRHERRAWTPAEALLVEVGWVGSDLSNRLIRGCFWAWFSLALRHLEEEHAPPSALLSLDEAHLFFPETTDASHAFSLTSLLAQHTAQGFGTLLLSDRGNLMTREIHQRTALTLLTQQDHAGALEHVTTLLDLSPRQRQRLAHLQPEEMALIARNSEIFLVLLS